MAKITLSLLVCLGLFEVALSNSLREKWMENLKEWHEHHHDHHDHGDHWDHHGDLWEHHREHWDFEDWDYEGKFGANKWGELFHQCKKSKQSPINLPHFEDISASIENDDNDELEFVNFAEMSQDECDLTDDGRFVKASCSSARLRVKGLGLGRDLDDVFVVNEFDFHSGGSEHTIGDERYPMEVQMVAYNAKYGNIEDAKDEDDGLAVVSVFVKVSGHDENSALSASESALDSMSSESNSATSLSNSVSNSLSESSSDEDSIASSLRESEEADKADLDNEDLMPLTEAFENLRPKGKASRVPMDVLKKLLPTDTKHFYRYKGSLTKPPCSGATWTIFRKPVRISSRQFALIKETDDNELRRRPIQDGDGIEIFRD